jgi:hypothetical protein
MNLTACRYRTLTLTRKTNASLSDEQVLQKHLATSLARYGFTAKDLKQ